MNNDDLDKSIPAFLLKHMNSMKDLERPFRLPGQDLVGKGYDSISEFADVQLRVQCEELRESLVYGG